VAIVAGDDRRLRHRAHDFAGLITVAGFLVAFALCKLGG